MSKISFENSIRVVGLLGLVLLMQGADATTFTVGGSKGWSVPNDNSAYTQWAQKMRFQIGDSLLFVYPGSSDSVLQVSKEDYDNCNTNSAIAKFTDGHTEFKFSKSGPYYFISGNKDNCNKNEKLVVVVMADRTGKNSPPSPPPSSPSPSPSTLAPAPAPTADHSQPPASPPAPGTGDVTPAPSAESHPPNSAASIAMSLGSVAAFVGSSVLLAF